MSEVAKLRFSLATALLLLALLGVAVASLSLYGQQGALVALPQMAFAIALHRFATRRRALAAVALTLIYACLWIGTATLGVQSLVSRTHDRFQQVQIPDVRHLTDDNPRAAETAYGSYRHIDTEGPWYYLGVTAVPCPLLIVADFGSMNEYQSGTGGRAVLLWHGLGHVLLSWQGQWSAN